MCATAVDVRAAGLIDTLPITTYLRSILGGISPAASQHSKHDSYLRRSTSSAAALGNVLLMLDIIRQSPMISITGYDAGCH